MLNSPAVSGSVALDSSKLAFIRRTYLHLLGAVLALVAFEVYLFQSELALRIAQTMLSTSWLVILGGFMLAGWLARRVAHGSDSRAMQYAALAGYVVAQGLLLTPLLIVAHIKAGGGVIGSAAFATVLGFAGLTAIVFTTRQDFSFLGALLKWGGFCALGLIVASVLLGFSLGTVFSAAMVTLAGAAILYDTSNILHHYPHDKHVAASLELFASVVMLFWYLLRLFSRR
jgi:FtsH-binding integral membrane protein